MSTAADVTQVSIAAHDAAWRRAWALDPQLDVDEWADRHRLLTSQSASEPGRWRTDRFPFVREIMRALSGTSPVRRLAWMAARQVGKTEVLLNTIGHGIQCSPGPMLIVQPTIDMAKKFSKQRLATLIDGTPALRGRVRPPKSRDSRNTLLVKEFDDGILMLAGANSSASLRSMPAMRVLADEVEEYPEDVDGQGDPLTIAEECAANYAARKIAIMGNPGIRGKSRIEREFFAGDQRRYFIPCPHCGRMDVLTWDGRPWYSGGAKAGELQVHHRIVWEKTPEGHDLPRTAHMVCSGCGGRVEEGAKTAMLEAGEWRATGDGDGETASYQISALYSPIGFRSWAECVIKILRAKKDVDGLRAWVNNILGETWEGETESASSDDLRGRLERYEAEVPAGVGVLTAGVDVQADRLIYVVIGWGAGEESWLIDWQELYGDPAKDAVWAQLDAQLVTRAYTHLSGRPMRVERVCIDSGGVKGHTDRVYRYCKPRADRGVFAVKGGRETGRPLVGLPTVRNAYRTPLFVLCVDTGKYVTMKRLAMRQPGPGYVHVHEMDDDAADEFCSQLTAEKALYGRNGRRWERVFQRNHVFDCYVYALAALYIMGESTRRGLGSLAEKASSAYQAAASPPLAQPAAPSPFGQRKPRGRWSGWRR